jgi:hypothetical protein
MIKNEPVLTAATVSGALIALASIFHVVLDTGAVETVVTALLPIVLALIARAKVSPVVARPGYPLK